MKEKVRSKQIIDYSSNFIRSSSVKPYESGGKSAALLSMTSLDIADSEKLATDSCGKIGVGKIEGDVFSSKQSLERDRLVPGTGSAATKSKMNETKIYQNSH